ncbi:MAG: SDR family oxidoreductase [Proteobacteria bacterium]|nr:SDR family oxidoreductase [Pseudomonadota bacterium]
MKSVFITGVSSGIGFELATKFLELGYCVYGISRRVPVGLLAKPNFYHRCMDASELDTLSDKITKFLILDLAVNKIDYLFLNIGEFNKRIALITDTPLAEYEHLMRVNAWNCKVILDTLLRSKISLDTVIFSSSIAGKRARKGMGPYAVSKAALNMLAELYALDHPELYFLVLGLCNVDTFLAKNVLYMPLFGDFKELLDLRERAINSDYVISTHKRALQILKIIKEVGYRNQEYNGKFIEIRNFLEETKEI